MARFHLERRLPYNADNLCQMVADVEAYPEFIPWITRLRAYNPETVSETISRFDADVSIGFKMLSETFTTRVTRDVANRTVDMNFLRGPFKVLNGRWSFTPLDDGTRIDFHMDIELRNPFLQALFKANFERVTSRLMLMFESRAAQLFERI